MHAELERRLSFCGNLPSLPAVAIRIIELANNPDVHLNDVARVIAMDPALVAKLFRAANSPLYGLRRQATNLRQVLNLLGLQGTMALALGFSLMAGSPGASAAALDADQFWRRSLLAATGCRILGERLGLKSLEELFLAGLLHGIGIMALTVMMPDRYVRLLAEATDHQIEEVPTLDCERLAALERERLQIDHAQVGAWLLHRWGLPDYLCQAVRGSLDPSDPGISDQHRTLVECVALSIHLADIWVRPGYWQRSSQVAELAREWLGLGEEDYVDVLEAISAKFPEIAELFQIKALDAAEAAGILDQAREVLTIRNARGMPLTLGRRVPAEGGSRPAPALLPDSLPVSATGAARSTSGATPPPERQYAFDALTGLFNRAQLEDILRRELDNAKTQGWPLSVALLDVDQHARINQLHGRTTGDQVLVALGRLFAGNIRRHDVAARYGNDEFALLLPAAGPEPTRRLLERLLELVRQWRPALESGKSFGATVSAGFAAYPDAAPDEPVSAEALLRAAERALQAAKRAGGDRLVAHGA